jgi:hypothetical protein
LAAPQYVGSIKIEAPGGSTSDGAQRNQKTFTVTPTLAIGDKLIWSYDFYDIQSVLSPYRQFANIQQDAAVDSTPPGQLVSMGLNNNQSATASGGNYYMARILGYAPPVNDPDGGPNEITTGTGSGAYFKLNDFGIAPLRTVGWHNLKVAISTADGTSTDYNFYVDNLLSEHVNVVGAPQTYTLFRMGAGVSSLEHAYYDNFRLEFIPGNDGDFSGNGVADAADYVVWRKNPGGIYTQSDFNTWRANFGNPPGAGSGLGDTAAVPEPSIFALVLLGAMLMLPGVRRR